MCCIDLVDFADVYVAPSPRDHGCGLAERPCIAVQLQEEMLGARVVIVANMKPANMRGIKSHAMVLCASTADGAKVHLDTSFQMLAQPLTGANKQMMADCNADPMVVVSPRER